MLREQLDLIDLLDRIDKCMQSFPNSATQFVEWAEVVIPALVREVSELRDKLNGEAIGSKPSFQKVAEWYSVIKDSRLCGGCGEQGEKSRIVNNILDAMPTVFEDYCDMVAERNRWRRRAEALENLLLNTESSNKEI